MSKLSLEELLWEDERLRNRDKQVNDNLNKTLTEANQLIAAIKADPKKYLNIRVSLF